MSWENRRRHDLVVSHRVALYADPVHQLRAAELIQGIVECEQLAHVVERAGGDGHDLERIEEACWPLREQLRQLDERNLPSREGTSLASQGEWTETLAPTG